jgi:hypothetical protein
MSVLKSILAHDDRILLTCQNLSLIENQKEMIVHSNGDVDLIQIIDDCNRIE